MFGNKKEILGSLGKTANALKPQFSTKTKGSVINNTPTVDSALKALAFHGRKKEKIG